MSPDKTQGFHIRRALNLNQPSAVFLKLIGLFLALIPSVLYCASLFLSKADIIGALHNMIRISFVIGASVAAIFLILVIVEQIQDRNIDLLYQKNRDRKLPLADGNYECQYCGNQKVKENDKTCLVCGKELK